jgi:ACS family tartrate transporter-like MFS transporter
MAGGWGAVLDEARDAALLRKISWRLLPLLALGYGAAYLDRTNIGFAALRMNADLHFSATVYGLGAGLFFVSYALFEVPSNLLLVRIGARLWMARIMLSWGLIACAMMFARTPAAFYALRFLLGLAEAGFFPGVLYYLTLWYPAAHRGRTVSRFYVAWPLSLVLGGAAAAPLLGLKGVLGLAGWQWLFLAEGLPAVILSGVFLWALPDSPAKAGWLDPSERARLAARLAKDEADTAPAEARAWSSLLKAPVLTLCAVNFLVMGVGYAFSFSAPLYLVGATGLTATQVGNLAALGGLLSAGAMLLGGWSADRFADRYVCLVVPLILAALTFAVMSQVRDPTLIMAGYVVTSCCATAIGGIFWTAPAPFLSPRSAALGMALISTVGQMGSFILTWLWGVARDATGGYQAGLMALPVGLLTAVALCLYLRNRASRLAMAAVTASANAA